MNLVRDALIIFCLVGLGLAIRGIFPQGPYLGISIGLAFGVGHIVGTRAMVK